MGEAKEMFQRDKEVSGRWSGFVHGPDSAKVFAIADAEFLNSQQFSAEAALGARLYKSILLSLSDVEETDSAFPNSGLVHDIDPKPRTKKTVTKK